MTDEELIEMARLAQRDDRMSTGALYGDLADRIEAQAAEIERLRDDLAKVVELVELLGQWRLASAGHVSVRSVIDKHDATLAGLTGAKP